MMKRFLSLAGVTISAVAMTAANVSADIVFTGSNISENFDSMGSTTVTGVFSATIGVQSAIPGSTGFEGTKIGGTGTAATNFIASDGSGNAGGIYTFGAASAADRALGAIASGSNVMGFGFRMVNNSASVVDSFTISFTQENWRSSTTTQNLFLAESSFDQTLSATSFLTSGTGFSATSALDLIGPAPVVTNGALNGNDPSNQTFRTFTFSGLSWAPGQQFFLRWSDTNDLGNDAGLAIDNMTITFTAVPEPASAGLLALAFAGFGLIRRRR